MIATVITGTCGTGEAYVNYRYGGVRYVVVGTGGTDATDNVGYVSYTSTKLTDYEDLRIRMRDIFAERRMLTRQSWAFITYLMPAVQIVGRPVHRCRRMLISLSGWIGRKGRKRRRGK